MASASASPVMGRTAMLGLSLYFFIAGAGARSIDERLAQSR